jgi:hypothetical protein
MAVHNTFRPRRPMPANELDQMEPRPRRIYPESRLRRRAGRRTGGIDTAVQAVEALKLKETKGSCHLPTAGDYTPSPASFLARSPSGSCDCGSRTASLSTPAPGCSAADQDQVVNPRAPGDWLSGSTKIAQIAEYRIAMASRYVPGAGNSSRESTTGARADPARNCFDRGLRPGRGTAHELDVC